ncbi:DUF3422 domain-containing protein [Kordiimonas pumila]|uniref:DUF3422 family protein n=1 Tax=Kordiimonas pumila TaxID=2161677 RepID=A0ABV7D8Q0_9PROT|nr:DUF3422 domain-containing protein [Kordiimonas pumila]
MPGPKADIIQAALNAEWHARPEMQIDPSMRCTHVVTAKCPDGTLEEVEAGYIGSQVKELAPSTRHHITDMGTYRVKWEKHTEVTCYTFAMPASQDSAFSDTPLSYLDEKARSTLLSEMKIGIRIEVLPAALLADDNGYAAACNIFSTKKLYGGWAAGHSAAIWSPFLPDKDGFIRVLICALNLPDSRLSRLVHRLLDIETYRILAMAALPIARKTMETLDKLEPALDKIIATIASNPSEEEQEQLLIEITTIAAKAEHLASSTAYRFAAAKAYEDIISRRLIEIKEEALNDHPRMTQFLSKSFSPAMRTCEAAGHRANDLTARISRAANLLNTMVDMAQKRQSHKILKSLETQGSRQIRLQQAVEGLSIFAVSYYGIGLVNYALKGAKAFGLPFTPEILTGLSVPIMLFLSWFLIRMVKKRVITS